MQLTHCFKLSIIRPNIDTHPCLAQLDRASAAEAEGHWFESSRMGLVC